MKDQDDKNNIKLQDKPLQEGIKSIEEIKKKT